MYDDVLVPTDGSDGAEAAIGRALDIATTADATVHGLSVVEEDVWQRGDEWAGATEFRQTVASHREAAVRTVADRASVLDLATVTEVRRGRADRAIRDYVDAAGIDLVVMGTHGRTGKDRTRLGSTTERVVTQTAVPVVAVPRAAVEPSAEPDRRMYDHVVVSTDGSDPATRAAQEALEWAARYGADVHVVYVVDRTTYDLADAPGSVIGLLKDGGRNACEDLAAEASERNLPVTTDVLRGVPYEELIDYADGVEADLLTLGTRGRTPQADRLLGSTTARLLRHTGVPLLVAG
jgi:nucleotide-binding universal stress UspA family protein